MGGYGSGRRWGAFVKQTVESCLQLDVNKLARDGLIRRAHATGTLTWTNTATGEGTASAGFRLEPVGDYYGLIFRLIYAVTVRGDKHDVDEPIRLTTTRPHFGGVRWWFCCPLIVDGVPCGRRVGKLYLPPLARYYGCRHCHDLTYRSAQEAHKFDALYRTLASYMGVPPAAIKYLLKT